MTSRGVAGLPIFVGDNDRLDFLSLLKGIAHASAWTCHAYCLMTTHYHVVVEATRERVSSGMHQLNGRYAMLFNRRHSRRGHLFESRFSAWVVRDEAHLEATCRYVLDNPARAGLDTAAAVALGRPRRSREQAPDLVIAHLREVLVREPDRIEGIRAGVGKRPRRQLPRALCTSAAAPWGPRRRFAPVPASAAPARLRASSSRWPARRRRRRRSSLRRPAEDERRDRAARAGEAPRAHGRRQRPRDPESRPVCSSRASLSTRAPPLAMAPIASSSCPGKPSFRTTRASSGASRMLGYLATDGHSASWQGQHEHVVPVRVLLGQPLTELSAGFGAVLEPPHGHPARAGRTASPTSSTISVSLCARCWR